MSLVVPCERHGATSTSTSSMAYFQSSLHAEIQNLKDALTASEKKADRYAQLSAGCYYMC